MDNALYVGLSNQMVLKRQMDIVANNIANADTNGFKFESLMTKTVPGAPAFTAGGPRPVKFVGADGVARDFGQGTLRRTDGVFDVGIEGQGFFKVTTKAGDRFTRDGHFRTDDNGVVTTQAGDPVADDGGGQITIDPSKPGAISISPDGIVSQGAERVGKIGVYKFDSLSALEKTGDNQYQNASNQQPVPTTDSKVRQGMLESSNVNPIVQITKMIEVNRAYEQVTQMMSSESDLSRNSVARLGKASSN
ncbi:MAG TPA: flagellar basal-body rod protein FlgF [Phenylobacterium sp.]|jgi:flagellar basal-body rod protein FlgF|uniref:flagellar basal-body rod protein FlgF n=1 Tax=Phenylobacterium sp. TaxID=1871053 RepID=UPI002D6FF531|nr:flagellar basal-body rod protein FlgF [Phenylobacterium sp.]HZZ66966.1 flagellar basal-body rod protein FlgF [Phenylobacterium sp.]